MFEWTFEIVGKNTKNNSLIVVEIMKDVETGKYDISSYRMVVMDVLTMAEIKELTTTEYIKDFYRELWQSDVAGENTEMGLADWINANACWDTDGRLFPGDDNSFRDEVEEAYQNLSAEALSVLGFGILGVDFKTFSINWFTTKIKKFNFDGMGMDVIVNEKIYNIIKDNC